MSSDPAEAGLLSAIRVVEDSEAAKQNRVILNVEDRFWREVLIDELKNHDVFTDGSFNRERLVLSAKSFVSACEKAFGEEGARIAAAVKQATKDGKKRSTGEVIQGLIWRHGRGCENGRVGGGTAYDRTHRQLARLNLSAVGRVPNEARTPRGGTG